jgi:hypothetical protein
MGKKVGAGVGKAKIAGFECIFSYTAKVSYKMTLLNN